MHTAPLLLRALQGVIAEDETSTDLCRLAGENLTPAGELLHRLKGIPSNLPAQEVSCV